MRQAKRARRDSVEQDSIEATSSSASSVVGKGRAGVSLGRLDGTALLEAAEAAAAEARESGKGVPTVVDFDLDLPGLKVRSISTFLN